MPRAHVGDLELAYDVEGAGEPLLLLMGLGGDRHGWDLVRGELARHHRLILLDNRDAGASDETRSAYGTADLASDALGMMDRLGIERFHVLGASMGGAMAQHLALQAPTRVRSMILVSTWGRTDAFLRAVLTGWAVMAERLAAGEFLAALGPWVFTHRFLEAPSAAVVAVQAALRERGVLKSVAAYRRQVDACLGHDALGLVPLLRTPTLVLVGEDDILTPPRYGRALAAALPRSEVTLVPASGHACFLETPKPVVDRTLRFLAKHSIGA